MSRKPSTAAHQKVLSTALELIAARGVEGTSMDAIAEASGVSKATIYKHWKDKDALMLELMAEMSGLRDRPAFDSGDTKSDMIDVLAFRPAENPELRDRLMPHFVAYSAHNCEFGIAWRQMVMEPPRQELRQLIWRGIEKRELAETADSDLSLALLLGPMLYGHMFLSRSMSDPRVLATSVVDAFWRAHIPVDSSANGHAILKDVRLA